MISLEEARVIAEQNKPHWADGFQIGKMDLKEPNLYDVWYRLTIGAVDVEQLIGLASDGTVAYQTPTGVCIEEREWSLDDAATLLADLQTAVTRAMAVSA